MSLKRLLDFSFGLCCYLLAVSMFFYFPGVEDWTFSAFSLGIKPSAWICGLLVLIVMLPAVFGPLAVAARARSYSRSVVAACCFTLAALFTLAGGGTPLLYGRVALIGLLTGQLLALGYKSKESVPYNWMLYLGFSLANFSFPDSSILAGANLGAGAYLLAAGILVLKGKWMVEKKGGYRVMVG
jgi:hypothetical protein